jgi:hypothetical protein
LDESGERVWVLGDDGSIAVLGRALSWQRRRRPGAELHVAVGDPPAGGSAGAVVTAGMAGSAGCAAVVARRASQFSPPPSIWRVEGRSVAPVDAAPHPSATSGPGAEWERLLQEHGVEPVLEHGVLYGEVLGLEVARVVASPQGAWRLSVGVGRHDRRAHEDLLAGGDAGAVLDDVVRTVRSRRRPGAGTHPATTLARERWLRAVVVGNPSLVGARQLRPVAAATPRADLLQPAPAPAVGLDCDGSDLVVVCSVGVDVDLVPAAADARSLHAPGARLLIVVPEGDDYASTRDLAGALREPAEVATVSRDWPALPVA